jgi:hypothetical protein
MWRSYDAARPTGCPFAALVGRFGIPERAQKSSVVAQCGSSGPTDNLTAHFRLSVTISSMSREHSRQSAVTKLALFDLDNTLFDRANAYREWAHCHVERMGLGQAEVEWFCEMDEDGFADRRSVWAKAKERFGLREPVDELLASYRSGYLDACKPDTEVLEGLEGLREAGWRVSA